MHDAVDRDALDDGGFAFAAGCGDGLVAAVAGGVHDGGDHFAALFGPVAPEHVGKVARQERVDVGRVADLDVLYGRPDLAFAKRVGHADTGLLVLAGQGGDLLDLPLQVGDRLLVFLDFGLEGHGRCQGTGDREQGTGDRGQEAAGAAGIRFGCVGGDLGVLTAGFRLDAWEATFCSWKSADGGRWGLPDGCWLLRFDKKSRTPNGARLRKKGAAAPRGEACNSLWLHFSRYPRYFARRAGGTLRGHPAAA